MDRQLVLLLWATAALSIALALAGCVSDGSATDVGYLTGNVT